MPGNTTLLPQEHALGFKISHLSFRNHREMLPRRSCSGIIKTRLKTIAPSAATATGSIDGSVRTTASSSSSFSFSFTNGNGITFYQLLGVKETASQTEIKAAYRSLAKLYHPDAVSSISNPNARDFIEIHNAYATLSDPMARARYDSSIGATAIGCARLYRQAAGFPTRTRRWETDQCW